MAEGGKKGYVEMKKKSWDAVYIILVGGSFYQVSEPLITLID
jgi:hypothetical protein